MPVQEREQESLELHRQPETCGHGLMVKHQLAKLGMRVRFSLSALGSQKRSSSQSGFLYSSVEWANSDAVSGSGLDSSNRRQEGSPRKACFYLT